MPTTTTRRTTQYHTGYQIEFETANEICRLLERAVGANSSNKIKFHHYYTEYYTTCFKCSKMLSLTKFQIGQAFMEGFLLGCK